MADNIKAQERLRSKTAFYAGLDATLDDNDDEPDPGRVASEQLLKKSSKISSTPAGQNGNNGLPRSASDTNLAKDPLRRFSGQVQEHRPRTSGGAGPPKLVKSATVAGPSAKPTSAAAPEGAIPRISVTGKRKRDGTVKLVPEAQQIFKGMQFYFFPNDDKNPARAMRIMKAIEFGASWQRDWNDIVTHIIVDKLFEYNMLLKFLKIDSVPSDVAVVSENYPSDCITFRTVLDPRPKRFQVKGHPQPGPPQTDVEVIQQAQSEQKKSLELKPPGNAVMTGPVQSPKTTDEATPPQPAANGPANEARQAEGSSPTWSAQPEDQQQIATGEVKSNAEFDAAIRQARELQFVSLEEEGEDGSRPTGSEGPDTDDEVQPHATSKPPKNTSKPKSKYAQAHWQDTFQCMQKHTGDSAKSPNAATIAILQQMADYYGQVGDQWRIRAYRKAIATLRNHPAKVWTKQEALALPQVGERLATKIEEIAYTNRLRRLDNVKAEPADQVLQTFMGVYGAGFAKASEWVAQGYRTLDELLARATLTENQRIGIEHYEDFNSPIPRAEVEQHGNVVRQALQKIDLAFEVIVGGSYRRGAATSGDIDCIITRPATSSAHLRAVVLEQLVPSLKRSGFLVASLASTGKDDGSKWHGASCPQGSKCWRRIDFLLVPSDEIGAALIYFTGNDIFNRSMRLVASKKGMRLNQRGLYKDAMRDRGGDRISDGVLVEGRDEKRIFEMLGVPWRPPEHRIC